MRGPADEAFCGSPWGSGDARMRERAERHMAQPTSDEAEIQRRNVKDSLQEEVPEIHDQSGPDSDKQGTPNVKRFKMHHNTSRSVPHLCPWSGLTPWVDI